MVDRYGDTYYCAHRADLIDSLAMTLPTECVRVAVPVIGGSESEDAATVTIDGGD